MRRPISAACSVIRLRSSVSISGDKLAEAAWLLVVTELSCGDV
nr:MAG TPA: hypothetical protein [Caudoviricetes sp.]